MRPKGKLFALLALFAAIGLITASGAFTTVEATRTADVSVAGDSNALLALEPHPSSDNANYASENSDGELEIDLSNVNLNALTQIDQVVQLTNQGEQDVYVWIEVSGDNAGFVGFYSDTTDDSNITTSDNAIQVNSGNSIDISIEIDTVGEALSANDELISEITVHAESEDPNAS